MQLRVVNEKPGKCSAACSSSVASSMSLQISIAEVYAGLGDKAQALEWLEQAYEERSRIFFVP